MSTAMTASVWGQGLAAIRLSAQVAALPMAEGDEECHICRDDIPATIAFVPCKHKVCFGCMENMRAKNIFKADKGIKCPFCRQYVDGYRSVHPPSAEVQRFLSEANKAAAVAASARAAAERKANNMQQQQQQHQGPSAAGGGRQAPGGAGSSSSSVAQPSHPGLTATPDGDLAWNCGSCGERNFFWREFCGRCKRPCPNPYASDKLSQTRKDLGVVTREELVSYLQDQGGFGLKKGLKDIGVSLDSQRVYGSVACMRAAVAQYGVKRVLHLADLLSDPDAIQAASLHYLGNLGVQRLLEGTAKLRSAFGPGSGKPQHPDIEAFMRKHRGRDPFGSMLAAITSRMLQFCSHDKGVYVLQGAAAVASNAELVAMAQAAFPLAVVVSRDPRGVFVLLQLLDLLSARIWDDEQNCEPALNAIGVLCQQYTLSDKQMAHNAMHALSGKVMVRAIAISMPRFPALKLAVKIACHASVLWPTSGGQFTLGELLQLYGHNQEAAEGVRDVVACMCYSMQGQIARMALSSDANVHELLLSLVERLGHEQETAWLDALVQEMVGVVDQLCSQGGQQTGLEILKFALTQPCLDLDTVSSHITDMKAVLPQSQLVPIVADLMERVSSNPAPPAPKYPAASAIQPELRYFLSHGYPTPLPPPPPPRPGDEGYEAYVAAAAAQKEAQAAAAADARAARDAEAAARREANAAANGGGSRNTAAIDAWSRLQAGGTDGGGGSSSNSNPWAQSTTSPPAAAGGGDGDAWAVGGASSAGGNSSSSSDPWAAVTGGDAWGGGASGQAAAAATRQHVPVAAPVAAPVVAPIAAPVVAPIAAPVAAPIAAPVAMPVFAAPVAAPIIAPPQQQAYAGRPAPPPQQQQQGMASWPAPQQAAQMLANSNNSSRSRTPSYPQQQQQYQQQQPPPMRPQSAPLRQQQPPQRQQQPQWEEPAAAAAAAAVEGPWACQVCTYEHTGAVSKFLTCAMCGTPKS